MRLHTRAFAIASGSVASAGTFLLTLVLVAISGETARTLPLSGVLFGYSVSVAGAFIGAMWAYAYGFLFGTAFAFIYNSAATPPAPSLFDLQADAAEEG